MNATTQLAQQFDIDFPEDEIAWFDRNIGTSGSGKENISSGKVRFVTRLDLL